MKVIIKKTKKLKGNINISGSKNSCLPLLALSLLTSKKINLTNVPMISDVLIMLEILKKIGVSVKIANNQVILKRKRLKSKLICREVTQIRASYYLIPGLINKKKKVITTYPGGCNFSTRPIDFHLQMLSKTNVKIKEKNNLIYLKRYKIKPNYFEFAKPSVGATINTILQTVLVKGTSIIYNQPLEPEIQEVMDCLNKMGAKIYTIGNKIIINGVKKLNGLVHEISQDRIELGSYILLSASTQSDITINNVKIKTFSYLEEYVKALGINYIYNNNQLNIEGTGSLKSINLNVSHFPNFPTDLQPILCASLLTSKEVSVITDNIYPKRISHIDEIRKLGGSIKYSDGSIIINESRLIGNTVYARDLRCGFSLIVSAIISQDETVIENFEVVNRGYESIIDKLQAIGVQIYEF